MPDSSGVGHSDSARSRPPRPRIDVRKVRRISKVELKDLPLTIGRSSSCDITLPDIHVSRRHCLIDRIDGEIRVRDLGSQSGTFVNGERIDEKALTADDRITVGPFELKMRDLPIAPPTTESGPSATDIIPLAEHAALSSSSAEQLAALEQRLHAQQQLSEERLQEISALRAQLETQPWAADGSTDEPISAEHVKALQAELEEQRRQNEAYVRQIAVLNGRLDSAAKREADWQAAVERLEHENATGAQRARELEVLARELEIAAEAEKHAAAEQEQHLRETIARLETDVQAASIHVSELETNLGQARSDAASALDDVAKKAAQIEELNAVVKALQDFNAEMERSLKQQIERKNGELEGRQRELDEARTLEATLRQQMRKIEDARNGLLERLNHAAGGLAALQRQIGALDAGVRELDALRERIADIESEWVDADHQIDETDPEDVEALERAAEQRHRLTAALDGLNRERDAVVARIATLAQNLAELAARQRVEVPRLQVESLPEELHSSNQPARRWWRFGLKV